MRTITVGDSTQYSAIHGEWGGVARSKGYFWLASRPELAGSWSQPAVTVRWAIGGMLYRYKTGHRMKFTAP
jgi:hypothetical protein